MSRQLAISIGKEVVARSIHTKDPVHFNRQLVPVDCAVVSDALLEADLFGYMKGTFTGTTGDRDGHLPGPPPAPSFLDEIGELPPALLPTGCHGAIPVDVRSVAATNRDHIVDLSGSTLAWLQHRSWSLEQHAGTFRRRDGRGPALRRLPRRNQLPLKGRRHSAQIWRGYRGRTTALSVSPQESG